MHKSEANSLPPELTPADVRRLVGRDNSLILEIGANDGTDTIEFVKQFPAGHIHCFECDPRAIRYWRERLGYSMRATLNDCALSDRLGVFPFHPSAGVTPEPEKYGTDDWTKSGSLLEPDRHTEFNTWLKFLPLIYVQTTTLDRWVDFFLSPTIIDFAWIDVQGAEAMVLRGAQKTLPRIRWLYCECNSLPLYRGQAMISEIVDLLPGFELISRHRYDNYLFRNTRL